MTAGLHSLSVPHAQQRIRGVLPHHLPSFRPYSMATVITIIEAIDLFFLCGFSAPWESLPPEVRSGHGSPERSADGRQCSQAEKGMKRLADERRAFDFHYDEILKVTSGFATFSATIGNRTSGLHTNAAATECVILLSVSSTGLALCVDVTVP
jgi:hypothetical protein